MSERYRAVVGQVLSRTYRVERLLGVGTVGAVYVARHLRTGGLCAVKVLHRKLRLSADAWARFQQEARILATLRHPYIVPVTDLEGPSDDGGAPYLVMELLEGESLAQRLTGRGPLPLSLALEVARQVGSALQAAHRSGVLHRNLKPENIFLVHQDLGDEIAQSARVMDFGLWRLRRAILVSSTLSDRDGEGMTALSQYTAPEALGEPAQSGGPQASGLLTPAAGALSGPLGGALAGALTAAPAGGLGGIPPVVPPQHAHIDGRADQWALAVILYRALSGRLPYTGDSLREVMVRMKEDAPVPLGQLAPELPDPVLAVVARGMARRREDRFESVAEMLRALSSASGALASAGSQELSRGGEGELPSGLHRGVRGGDGELPSGTARTRPQPLLAAEVQKTRSPVPVAVPGSSNRRTPIYAGVAALLLLIAAGTALWQARVSGPEAAAPGAAVAKPRAVHPGESSLSGVSAAGAAVVRTPAVAAPAEPVAVVAAAPARAGRERVGGGVDGKGRGNAAVFGGASGKAAGNAGVGARAGAGVGAQLAERPSPAAGPESEQAAILGERVLQEAQVAFAGGQHDKAVALALSVAQPAAGRAGGRAPAVSAAAWRFLGSAACRLGDVRLATRSYRHLAGSERQFMISVCQRQGLVVVEGEFLKDSWR